VRFAAGGSVTLSAGQDVRISASDVLSQAGTAIVGQNVTIEAGVGTADSHQSQSLHTGGIVGGLTGGAASAAEQVWASGQRAGQVKDKRLAALYAAQAGYAVSDAYQGISNGVAGAQGQAVQGNQNEDGSASASGAQGAANASGVSLRIGIGASSAAAHSDSHDDIAYASHIQSAGDVTIAATGGDLNLIGSQVSGDNVTLAAAHNLNLLSQTEQHTQKESSANASGEVGLSIGSTTGIYVSVAGGKGRAHGNGQTHATSDVQARDTLHLASGNDTTIQGAQARGNTVLADIGGNLSIASEQDTDDYASTNVQAGITFVYGFSGSGVGVSGNLAYGQMDSDYASVTQVSGLAAGSGGYHLDVGGNTDLKGGVIASTADPQNNHLSTGTLTYSDIANKAHYDAFSVSIGGGYGTGAMGGGSFTMGGSIPQDHSSHSTTQAGIAQGTIEVRNGPADLSGLDRNPDIDAKGLKSIFDQEKVQERQEMGQVAGYVGMRAAGTLAERQRAKAQADWLAAPQGSEAEADAKARLAQWSDGGTYKTLLHGAVGAGMAALGGGDVLQGALGAGASEKASGAMQAYLLEQGIDPDSGKGKELMELASAAVGGVAGGGSGAVTALDGELYNRQLHDWEHKLAKELAAKSNGKYTVQQIEDAMRNSSYGSPDAPAVDFAMGDNVGKGELYAYTPPGTAELIMSWSAFGQAGGYLDPGASFTFPMSQNPGMYGYENDVMAVQDMPRLDRGAADFIAAHMSDVDIQKSYASQFDSDYGKWQYTWLPEQKPYEPEVRGYVPEQQGVNGNNMTFYDTMLGRVVTIGVSGVCATAECAMKGGNFDMADPRTQQYLSDVGHAQLKFGATVASVAVGGAWATLAKEAIIPSWMAYSGAGATSAGANAAAQYLTTGTVRAPDVIFAGVTGTYGGWAARLPGWQAPVSMMIVNTGGAAANTVVDNVVYGEKESIGNAILTSGLGTIGGYKIGDYADKSNVSPWIVNSISAFSSEFVTRKTNDVLKNIQPEKSAPEDKDKNP